MVNVFRIVRKAKLNAMRKIEAFNEYRGPTEEDLKATKELRSRIDERKKLQDKIYKEKEAMRKSKLQLRKRTPAYRVVHALKENIKKNKGKKRKLGTLPGENFRW